MNRRVSKILIITFVSYLVFFIIVVILFNHIRHNKTDEIAMTYIWNCDEIYQQIGEIEHVGRNIREKTYKSDSKMIIPYSVETKESNYYYIVFVTLNKKEGKWVANDFSIKKGSEIS